MDTHISGTPYIGGMDLEIEVIENSDGTITITHDTSYIKAKIK